MALLASCFWCGRTHAAEYPLSLCPSCAASYRARRFPLGSLQMNGAFPLDDATIDERVSRTSPGNYALGYMDEGTFVVFYVGRSDSDVRSRLHEWVGAPSSHQRHSGAGQAPWALHQRGASPLAAPALGPVEVADSSYTRFAYSYAPSARAAFEKECRNYDDFGRSGALDNATPPTPTPA
jgi:hypothetical protein